MESARTLARALMASRERTVKPKLTHVLPRLAKTVLPARTTLPGGIRAHVLRAFRVKTVFSTLMIARTTRAVMAQFSALMVSILTSANAKRVMIIMGQHASTSTNVSQELLATPTVKCA